MSKHHEIVASDWSVIEEKVADQRPDTAGGGGRSKSLYKSLKVGKGRKGQVLKIPRALFPELKRAFNVLFWNQETVDVPTNPLSIYGFLGQITQGNSSGQRTGDIIRVERIVIRMYCSFSSSQFQTTISMALIKDKQPAVVEATASAPAWTDMFQGGGASTDFYQVAIPNYDKRWRFDYLKRIEMPTAAACAPVTGSTTITYDTCPRCLVWDVPIKVMAKYDNTMATPYAGGEIWLTAWSDVSSNVPKVSASFEIFFSDA